MTAAQPDVTRGRFAVSIEFGAGKLPGQVFVGRPEGEAARQLFKLAELDHKKERVFVKVPEDIFSITSSFFLGLFGDSIRAEGTRDGFLARFAFEAPDRVWGDTIDPGIKRALFERKDLVPSPASR